MRKKAETEFHKDRANKLVNLTGVPVQVVDIIPDDVPYARAVWILEIIKKAKERFKGMPQLKQLLESAEETDRVRAINELIGYDETDALEDDVPAKLSNKVFADYVLGKYDKKPGICRSDIYKGYPAMVKASEKNKG